MSSLNKVTLIGNLCKDPEIRSTNTGKEIASFSLATNESWLDKSTGERKTAVEYHNIVIFNEGLVNVVKNYIKKGSKIYVEGQLKTRKWQDKEGKDRYTTEIVLQGFSGNLIMLDSKSNNSESSNSSESVQDGIDDLDSEIPF